MTDWPTPADDGVLFWVRVVPGAAREGIEGIETRADGTTALKLRIAAPPERGRANAAVVALLARALALPKSAIVIRSGRTARLKRIAIAGDPHRLAETLRAMVGQTR